MIHEKTSCLNLRQFPPTSNAIKLHIYHAYLQAYIWYNATIKSTINLDPELHGFTCDEDEKLVSIINDGSQLPADFPFSCKCNKWKIYKRCPY